MLPFALGVSMIDVRNKITGYHDKIKDWNADKQTLKLQSGLIVIDRQHVWQYYNPTYQRWMFCFTKKG